MFFEVYILKLACIARMDLAVLKNALQLTHTQLEVVYKSWSMFMNEHSKQTCIILSNILKKKKAKLNWRQT